MAEVGNAVCWGVVVVAWIVGGAYNVRSGPRTRTHGGVSRLSGIAVAVALALIALTVRGDWHRVQFHVEWARALGLAILVCATLFTLWARFALGTMWSMDPAVKQGHRLRTDGPYAITRHPIYTGILGMLLGSTLLDGGGQWLLIVPIGLVVLGAKLRTEERLMDETFPDEYRAYRQRVPALVPFVRRR